ncbi:hypothetical protein [Corynebacterium sp.]|uniref:hypothetical protein n=1 Tax=Corynebacterium sp. TaxID=1720 RepID=UPI002A90BBBE|nr:hypothetical protein [Corynebacterium sp.]MDY5785866.1 hypothetical protein [Corynebacterium sp.]
MDTDLQLIIDGDGVAVFGDPHQVELFLSSNGLNSRELDMGQLVGNAFRTGAGAAQVGSQLATNSGHWVKLTKESAKALKLGKAMKGSADGVSRAIATTQNGKITTILEFAKPGAPGLFLTSPMALAGAASLMSQLAMQQTIEEITEYLQVIDEKVDEVLRAQKDAALAQMTAVGLVIDSAMLKREHVGRVSETTWSSLHGAAQTIAASQAYALRQLDAVAEKLEKKRKVANLAKLAAHAEADVEEWLAILARCFQLQDSLDVLELDRILDSAPHDLDNHREAIRAGRRARRDLISATTQRLLERIDAVALIANNHVLTHPQRAKSIVASGNEVGTDITTFNQLLGIQQDRADLVAKKWSQAVGDARDKAVHVVGTGATATVRHGAETAANIKEAGEGLAKRVSNKFPGSGKTAKETKAKPPQAE